MSLGLPPTEKFRVEIDGKGKGVYRISHIPVFGNMLIGTCKPDNEKFPNGVIEATRRC